MKDTTRENLTNPNIWQRGLFMVFYLIAYNIAEIIIVLVTIFQFLCVLITGRANEATLIFGKNLGTFARQIFDFLTFNSDRRPFPFEPFPDEVPGGENWLDDYADFEEIEPEPEPETKAESEVDTDTDTEKKPEPEPTDNDAAESGDKDANSGDKPAS